MKIKPNFSMGKEWIMVVIMMISIAILPEFIAPIITLAYFPFYKRSCSLAGKKVLMGDASKMMLIMTVYLLITAIWSPTHIFSALIALLWMGMLLCSFIISNTVDSKEKLRGLFFFITMASAVVSIIAIIEVIAYYSNFYFPNPLWNSLMEPLLKKLPLEITYNDFTSRAASTFDNPLTLATYLVAALPIGIRSLFVVTSKKKKILCGIACVLMITAVGCTFSRGALAAVALSMVVFIFQGKKYFKFTIPAFICAGVAGVLSVCLRYMNSATDMLQSSDIRSSIWGSCLKIFKSKPIFGHGAGNQNVMNLMKEKFGIDHPHAHNLYLELLCEAGIVGLLLFFAVFAIVARDLIKIYSGGSEQQRGFAISMTSAFVGFFAMSMTEYTLQSPRELMLLMSLIGITEAGKRVYTNKRNDKTEPPLPPAEKIPLPERQYATKK